MGKSQRMLNKSINLKVCVCEEGRGDGHWRFFLKVGEGGGHINLDSKNLFSIF